MLLTHRAGMPANSNDYGPSSALVTVQRLAYLDSIINAAPAHAPGTKFSYSNAGYIVTGTILERIAGISWEEILQRRLFKPLGMTSTGFGPPSKPNATDQPWGHILKDSKFQPRYGDNHRALGPAGTVHCSVRDYLKFADFHASNGARPGGLLSPASFETLHTPAEGQDYAMGWGTAQRTWAQGTALTHNGSNTMNFFVVWIAPKSGFSIAVASNAASDNVPKALDDVAAALVKKFAA
jgi:CubicO group peptidase (beta-lactamase class C family)